MASDIPGAARTSIPMHVEISCCIGGVLIAGARQPSSDVVFWSM